MSSKNNNGFRSSFGNAFTGFKSALITERNLKIHFVVGIFAILASIILRISLFEWCIIVLTIAFVIVAELFNTAIECSVDLASPGKHELARKAKDISASAVLTAALCAMIIGFVIFLPKILLLINRYLPF